VRALVPAPAHAATLAERAATRAASDQSAEIRAGSGSVLAGVDGIVWDSRDAPVAGVGAAADVGDLARRAALLTLWSAVARASAVSAGAALRLVCART
jgi:hypothetical protein